MTTFTRISPDSAIWYGYDLRTKVDRYSTAILSGSELTIIDPIILPKENRLELESMGSVSSILITNANHARDADTFSKRYSVPIFAPEELKSELPLSHTLHDKLRVGPLEAIRIAGAAPGEFALYASVAGGTLIIGDALINFDSHAFTFLPAKYCLNHKRMLRSLQRLLDYPCQRILFAHGDPITTRAQERLRELLKNKS